VTPASKSPLGTRGRPEQTRGAILRAAIQEFAHKGIAGARTDAIARNAKVNKALLYYYFKDKDSLYLAALDSVFTERNRRILDVLQRPVPPGEKLHLYVGEYFDYLAANPLHRDLVQREMMRASSGAPSHLHRIAQLYMKPVYTALAGLLREGERAGEFRAVDPAQFVPFMIAVVVFSFSSAPMMKLVTNVDPLAPERLAERRSAILDFISAALFRRRLDPQGARS
jgi:TetR/AcrR family transcriptional regulator